MSAWNDRRTPPGQLTDLSVQMGAKYRGQVVALKSQEGSHPDFTDKGDRYYVRGASPYGKNQAELKGIPGHTNGSVHTELKNVQRAPKGKLKKAP